MSKYRSNSVKVVKERSGQPHFLWRGIGCVMMLVIPAMSAAIAYEVINYGLDNNWPIPFQLLGTPRYPDLFYRSSGMMTILSPITAIRHFYAYAVGAMIFMIIIGGIMSLIYAYVYRMVGPAQYGPLDAPPPNVKVKRYKR